MLGISFVPDQQTQTNQQNPAEPLQQAVQMLSLRMPRFAGTNAIAPDLLLQSKGAAGLGLPMTGPGQDPYLGDDEWLRKILFRLVPGPYGGFDPNPQPKMPTPPAHVNPGMEPGEPFGGPPPQKTQPAPGMGPKPPITKVFDYIGSGKSY